MLAAAKMTNLKLGGTGANQYSKSADLSHDRSAPPGVSAKTAAKLFKVGTASV